MGIVFHERTKEFHLYNQDISYILGILENGQPGQIYYGKRIHDSDSFQHLIEYGIKDMAPCAFEGNRMFSMEYLRQEYPSYGRGDMRYPAYELHQADGSRVSEFIYDGYSIFNGKKRLFGLPAVYVEAEDEAETLEIFLKENVTGTKLTLSYTIFRDFPVICRNALFRQGVQSIHSMRGHSSHQFNPFFALKRHETTEHTGEIIGMSLIYSGNFIGQVNVDTFGVARAMAGIHPEGFAWTLRKGECFQTPEAVCVYSQDGLNGMSQVFHKLYRKRLARGKWRDKVRPVVINSWEAVFMDFTENKILEIAETAKDLGVEMMVLDDGWFGKRDDDTSSLGDWYPNRDKLPGGIKGLAQKIENLGMRFGLWIEPEMISKDSDLYRKHPEWLIRVPYRQMCHGRNQYVLDFSKDEVVEGIGNMIISVLKDAEVSYIKWDMNRSISEAFSQNCEPEAQGKLFHKYVLGVYRLYERLETEFPDILFESCASGGARFDPGMLYYAPQCWTSDNTDAIERIRIQYGTSVVYPLSSMGCHVSAVPNHQTFRNTPLKTRADVAYFGCFGYEMDLNTLHEEEKREIREQIAFYKTYRSLIAEGKFYRLLSPFEGDEAAWMVVSEDNRVILAAYYRMRQPSNAPYKRLRLKGLEAGARYSIEGREGSYYGDELMYTGMVISDYACGIRPDPTRQGDYQSRLFILKML